MVVQCIALFLYAATGGMWFTRRVEQASGFDLSHFTVMTVAAGTGAGLFGVLLGLVAGNSTVGLIAVVGFSFIGRTLASVLMAKADSPIDKRGLINLVLLEGYLFIVMSAILSGLACAMPLFSIH